MQRHLTDFRVQLSLVAAAGLGIRIWSVLAWQRNFPVEGDQIFYHYQARALADGAGFVNPWAWNAIAEEIPTALHPPLYSVYLGLWSVVGVDTPLGHKLVSCLLGAALVVVLGLVGRRLAGRRAGIATAVIAAAYPVLWINDGGLAAESLYALLIAIVLLFSYRLWDDPSTWNAAGLGATVALAALTRAEAAVFFPLLVLPLVILLRGPSARDKLRLLVLAGVAGAVLMAPWVIRNMATFEGPSVLSNGAGFVIEIANCDETYSGDHLGYWDVACDRPETWLPEQFPDRNDAARHETTIERSKRDAGVDYMTDNLGRVPIVLAARIGRMWEVYAPNQNVFFNDFFERRGHWPSRAGQWMYFGLLALSVYGLVVLRRRRITLIPFIALAASVTITAAMSFGITRYRVALDVGLTVLAGVVVAALWARWRDRGTVVEAVPAADPSAGPTERPPADVGAGESS